jgi:hypothetical protein
MRMRMKARFWLEIRRRLIWNMGESLRLEGVPEEDANASGEATIEEVIDELAESKDENKTDRADVGGIAIAN